MASTATTIAASGRLQRLAETIARQVAQYRDLCDLPEATLRHRDESVSQWGVADQIDHIIKADDVILGAVLKTLETPPSNVEGRPVPIGRIVLLTGFIPRGKGKAPAITHPKPTTAAEMRAGFDRIAARLGDLVPRLGEIERSPGRAPHPMLGAFTGAQWLRFMDVHHVHHMKIIRDIRKTV